MKYLSLELSQLLHSKGCTSESRSVWVEDAKEPFHRDLFFKTLHSYVRHYDGLSLSHDYIYPRKVVPAYIFEDLTNKANLIKLFGEGMEYFYQGHELFSQKLNGDWQEYLLHQLKGTEK